MVKRGEWRRWNNGGEGSRWRGEQMERGADGEGSRWREEQMERGADGEGRMMERGNGEVLKRCLKRHSIEKWQ